jgi:hypothetical protein
MMRPWQPSYSEHTLEHVEEDVQETAKMGTQGHQGDG